jgi:chromosome segregation ATPase
MAEIITLTVKQVGVSEAEKSLNNMLTTIKAINSTPINVSVTGSGAKAAEQYKEAVTVTQTEVKKLSQSFKDTEKSGNSLLKNVIKNAQWYYISGAVSAATRSFKDAIATMKEVDAEMVSIQKVTGYTKEQMDRLSDSAYALASAYGRTAQEILSAETTFARAGYTDQIEDLAELAVLTQNVGDVNADTASKFLIAADAAWKLGGNAKELTEIIDGMNNVTNKNAVDMKALTEGLTVSASAFAEAGESAQTYTAMVGAGVAATQRSGNEVARAMRTIIMNVRQIRGETEDGELIDGESIANAAKALKEYADISTMQNGELRKTYDVLDELAGKWESLGSVAKSAITEALAGKYRANILSALLNDWDSVSKIMQDYADGVGSALEENGFYLQSWDAKTKQLQSTWTEFVAKTVDEDWIKGLISSVTWLIEGLGSLGNALLILGGIISTFKMPSILSFLSSAVAGIGRLIAMVKLATTNFTAFSLVVNTTQLAIGAITAAITIGIVAYNKIKQAREEARQAAIDAGNAAAAEAESLKDLYQSYTDAKKAYDDGTGSKAALLTATEKLWKATDTEAESVDTLTFRYGSLKTAIDQVTEAKLQADLYDAKAGVTAAGYALVNNGGVTEEFGAKTPEKVLEYYNQFISSRNEMIDSGTDSGATWQNVTREISRLKPLVDEYNTALENQKNIEEMLQALRDGTLESYGRERDALDENAAAAGTQATALEKAGKALKAQQENLKSAAQAMAEYQKNGKVSNETIQKLISMSSDYSDILVNEDGTLNITEESLRLLNAAIADNITQTESQIGVTGTADDAAAAYVTSLIALGEASGATGQKLYELVLEEIKLNNMGLDLSGQIAQVIALGRAAGATAASIASISGMKSSDADRTIKGWLQTGQVGSYEEGEQKLLQGIYDSFDYSESSWNKSGSSGSKGSGSGGGGSSSDARLTAHKERVTLLKSELTLLEKQGASEEAQKNKMRQIQNALNAQADYMRSIGYSQAEINDLSSEWYDWQKKINEQTQTMEKLLSDLQSAMQDSLSSQQDARDAELAAIDAQIDALKKRKESKDDELTLEEKILAVQKAQANLANARNERTIRQYNAKTGQWEWVADAGKVKSAEESLENAKKDLEDFKENAAYEAAIAELEAKKDAINARYDALERQYNNFLDSLKAKTRGIAEILQDIWKNATPELKKIILENAELFRQFGIDVTKLSDVVTETVNRIVKVGADGKAPSGLSVGDRVVTGGGTYEITGVNPDGTYQSVLVDKNQTTYNYKGEYDDPPGAGGSGGGSGSGQKYSGTVYGYASDGSRYTISSERGIRFLNTASAGETLSGGDGSHWVKNANGTTTITKRDGKRYTVYDKGGILEGMGGIKATEKPEMVLPPDVTKVLHTMMLRPQTDMRFERGMDRMRMALGIKDGTAMNRAAYDDHRIGTQYSGNVYQLGGISISEEKARVTSVYDLARMARTLAISSRD